MSYFIEIESSQTYTNLEVDFHFSYNANSGGGQSFLGGKFRNEKGDLTSPLTLDGCKGLFEYIYIDAKGKEKSILLRDSKCEYEIKPRGEGSTSMKLGIGTKMKTPSKLITTFFMLPPTCVVKSPNDLRNSILTSNNYWLQSMWLKCKNTNENEVHLIPIDFIFCGGKNKENKGKERYFKLEDNKRINDLIKIANESDILPYNISKHIRVFADVYLGNKTFDYEACSDSITQIMQILAETYPDKYSGIEDPLPFINQLLCEKKRIHVATFGYTTYRPYITAIKSKPFLLLAGISGTGKSRIVRELARACWGENSEEFKAQKPKNFEMIQVKPNWHDSSELIGYVSRVSGKAEFVAGEFLKFIAKAWEDTDTPYFLCLDEMNLAPVEQYFAEYLSVIESRKSMRMVR
ncbi:McrB family protein [Phocaeicola barnesiae]|uniref:McrB family protein n=1 Tax=Phocaeicola barnesiae TaxID=376804 RepID=UPI001F4572BC|nr:AAA family ATPase [Phocaeicola barnesiae]